MVLEVVKNNYPFTYTTAWLTRSLGFSRSKTDAILYKLRDMGKLVFETKYFFHLKQPSKRRTIFIVSDLTPREAAEDISDLVYKNNGLPVAVNRAILHLKCTPDQFYNWVEFGICNDLLINFSWDSKKKSFLCEGIKKSEKPDKTDKYDYISDENLLLSVINLSMDNNLSFITYDELAKRCGYSISKTYSLVKKLIKTEKLFKRKLRDGTGNKTCFSLKPIENTAISNEFVRNFNQEIYNEIVNKVVQKAEHTPEIPWNIVKKLYVGYFRKAKHEPPLDSVINWVVRDIIKLIKK